MKKINAENVVFDELNNKVRAENKNVEIIKKISLLLSFVCSGNVISF